MPRLNNAMEIFKLLEKSNCGKCNETTCLAFAGAVFLGRKRLEECPGLPPDVLERFGGKPEKSKLEQDQEESLNQLKNKIRDVDLSSAAPRTGGVFSGDKLTIKVLGKDFSVDARGNLSSDIHIHPWVAAPVFNYILRCAEAPVSGKWVPLRELKDGEPFNGLFVQRCEKPLKKVADAYTDLFEDMIHLFNGKQVENHYQSDISLVLHPLPKAPILICYWRPEDGLESSLNLFFDSTAEDNLGIKSVYGLAAGLVVMFEKISLRHGVQ
ncbi:MAG: DUF3786 domain-containing protein [Desulfobacterales bacterium]|nr:DUF3786 domain-containing protein [Desulfobacterales bacterium]